MLTLSQTSPGFYVYAVQVLSNTVGKGEIARYEQFLLFPQCFLPTWRTMLFSPNSELWPANYFSLEESKICYLGKGLRALTDDKLDIHIDRYWPF